MTHLLLQTCTQMFPASLNAFEVDEEGSVDWPYLCTGHRWSSARLGSTAA